MGPHEERVEQAPEQSPKAELPDWAPNQLSGIYDEKKEPPDPSLAVRMLREGRLI